MLWHYFVSALSPTTESEGDGLFQTAEAEWQALRQSLASGKDQRRVSESLKLELIGEIVQLYASSGSDRSMPPVPFHEQHWSKLGFPIQVTQSGSSTSHSATQQLDIFVVYFDANNNDCETCSICVLVGDFVQKPLQKVVRKQHWRTGAGLR